MNEDTWTNMTIPFIKHKYMKIRFDKVIKNLQKLRLRKIIVLLFITV